MGVARDENWIELGGGVWERIIMSAMRKRRRMVGIISLLGLISARAADISTTYHFSPTLQKEGNPIVTVWHLGWNGLLISEVPFLVLIAAGLWAYGRGRTKRMTVPVHSSWDFAPLCLYNRAMTKAQFILASLTGWPLPKDWYQAFRYIGLILSWGIISGSLYAVMSWWLIWYYHIGWFWRFYRVSIYNYPVSLLIVALIGAVIAAVYFFVTETREANNNLSLQS